MVGHIKGTGLVWEQLMVGNLAMDRQLRKRSASLWNVQVKSAYYNKSNPIDNKMITIFSMIVSDLHNFILDISPIQCV